MTVKKEENGIRKFNKWLGLIIALVSIFSMLIGVVAGMTVKSMKIDEAYDCSKRNEKSIHDLREIMIRIDANMQYIRNEIDGLKK